MRDVISTAPNALTQVHGPFRPVDVRRGEPVRAFVSKPTGAAHGHQELKVWRMSPYGVELVLAEDMAWQAGDVLMLWLQVGRQRLPYRGVVVGCVRAGSVKLLGVRLPQDDDTSAGVHRWACGALFYPSGWARNPVRFNDAIMFRVRAIAASGMTLITSLRNCHLARGLVLDAQISLPSIGQVCVTVQITHLTVSSEEQHDAIQVVEVNFVRPSRQALDLLGQYVLQFGTGTDGPPSLRALRQAGFTMTSAAQAFDFDFVKSAEDYRQVLALRYSAFGGAGKLGGQSRPEDMADIYDSRARILVGRFRGQVVASLRLVYHGPGDRFEHENFLTFPASFPPREQIVEASRACTHPDYRGSDLLAALFAHTALTTLQSGYRYVLQSATETLTPMYARFGFRDTGLRFEHPTFRNELHILSMVDVKAIRAGVGINPLVWSVLFSRTWDLMGDDVLDGIGFFGRVRAACYRLLAPLAWRMLHGSPPRSAPHQLVGVLKMTR